jgi:hypothetical protein
MVLLTLGFAGCVWLAAANINRARLASFSMSFAAGMLLWALTLCVLFVPWLRKMAITENARLLLALVAIVPATVLIGLQTIWQQLPALFRKVLDRRAFGYATVVAAFAATLIYPAWIIRPMFATPAYLAPNAAAALPGAPVRMANSGVEIRGHQIEPRVTDAGQRVALSLVWGATRPIDESYRVRVELLDAGGAVYHSALRAPSYGAKPTTTWTPNQFFRDEYLLSDVAARQKPSSIRLSLITRDARAIDTVTLPAGLRDEAAQRRQP